MSNKPETFICDLCKETYPITDLAMKKELLACKHCVEYAIDLARAPREFRKGKK